MFWTNYSLTVSVEGMHVENMTVEMRGNAEQNRLNMDFNLPVEDLVVREMTMKVGGRDV